MNAPLKSVNEAATNFVRRHIGPSPRDIAAMLESVGAKSLGELMGQTLPSSIRQKAALDLGRALSETEALAHMGELAAQNQVFTSLIGQGYSGTILPAVIQRNILENPAWYTAYTPYQPEISQGRLEALFNFQTMICDLTGLDVANASLLDEATAAAEAMALAERAAQSRTKSFFVDSEVHPQTLAVLRTRAEPLGWKLIVGDPLTDLDDAEVLGGLLQYPGTSGAVRDIRPAIAVLRGKGALSIVAADLLALTLLASPGELGADIAIGSAQRFGVPMGYGGPHAAYMAVRDALKRSLPGRLVGLSIDSRGQPAYRLALQTREQHIRRDKATSNICTAEVLLAVIASMYAVYHGPKGLRAIAARIHRLTSRLADGLRALGCKVTHENFFDTIRIEVESSEVTLGHPDKSGFNLRELGPRAVGISFDETTTPRDIELLMSIFRGTNVRDFDDDNVGEPPIRIPQSAIRTSEYLAHPLFHTHDTETEMLRYLKKLESRDLSLTTSMIPLGSCTMKLNATAEMFPISWPEFAKLHPFAPEDQTVGYREMCDQLGEWLAEITGFAAVALQPNAGSQGEFTGLLAIREYHAWRGEAHRNICIIPTSAYGTNPASAVMAGFKVVPVACLRDGDIDLADLRAKVETHKDDLAALMVTYPSTHGVFETTIREICEIVHSHGGQVYMDGANMNAQVGLCRPGDMGADVCHLNLHKTFCIPHGGGGPGMGPIGVADHLVAFLPGHTVVNLGGENPVGAISSAPWGSAGILPISWVYIAAMGAAGLTEATKVAILNANYLAKRLEPY